ncbi:hypothetical protein [Paraburkholderia saeva]|nr:hypothetical protein [Paraburkholderia saeva]
MKTKLYLAGALALVVAGVYLDRRYQQAGGASGLALQVGDVIWNNAAGAVANVGTSLYTNMTAFADTKYQQQQAQLNQPTMPFTQSAWDGVPMGL